MEINHIPASFAARRLTRSRAPAAGQRAHLLARSRACCDEQHNDKRISEAVYSGRLIDSHYYGSERTHERKSSLFSIQTAAAAAD